ncbi:MAG: DUF5752 family protein [Bacteroidota bacterium]
MSRFQFMTKSDLTLLLGKRARNATELCAGLREVPAMSVYYHTHRFLQQHHYLSPEPPNDFAYWATNVLNDDALGERLASIDIVQFVSIEEIRRQVLTILEDYLQTAERHTDSPRGEEFHFMACQTFVFPTPYVATNLSEFADMLERVSIDSIYYHMFDARMRPELGNNDFSIWIRDSGNPELAKAIQALDPYSRTLEGLRRAVIRLVEDYAGD